MLYSKALLSKKGALETVWVAAVCGLSALTREQVVRTNVAASVDKILPDVETAYRILGLLLLGIVRIYSKKVEYLCHDCSQLLESFGEVHCTEASTSTGRSMNRVLKQMKKAVCSRRLVVEQQDISKIKKVVCAVRTTAVSNLISSEGLSSRAETGVTSQTLADVREACAPTDLPIFTIPKRFELDSFDLEIAEDRDDDDEDHHQLPRQDTLLGDERHHTSYLYESHQRLRCSYADLDSAFFMPVCIAIGEVNNLLYLSNTGDGLESDNQNADSACFTPVKDVLPPEMMDMMAEVNDPSEKNKRGEKPVREVDMEDNGDSACPIPLPEGEEGQRYENLTCPHLSANCPPIEESENGLLLGNLNTASSVVSPHHGVEEHESLEHSSLCCKTQPISELSPPTPEPLPESVAGSVYSPKFMVTTPAKKEKCRVTRKRRRDFYNKEDYIPTYIKDKRQVRRRGTRALYDEVIVLSNEMLRQAIEDASDLVYQRTKAPHTCLDVWKDVRIGSLAGTFMNPLIPYSTSVHLSYAPHDAPESSCGGSLNAKRRLSYDLSESYNSSKDAKNVEREDIPDEPKKRKLDTLTNSIQTPGGCYTEGAQFQDDGCEDNDDTTKEKDTQVKGNESSSAGLPEKRSHESKNNKPLCNEALNAAIDSVDEDIPMDEEHTRDEGLPHSTRTRTVARCLHQLFLNQKLQGGNSSVSISQALEGRKKKTSARFFYETLILKSHGLIEVNQDHPYEDIIVSSTPQLEAEF